MQGRGLADSESLHAGQGQSVTGPGTVSDLFLSQAAVQSHLIASNASHPTWASGKSKLISVSGPVTSWPERPGPAGGRGGAGPAQDVHQPEGTGSHSSLFY